jgi:hypothetical protein
MRATPPSLATPSLSLNTPAREKVLVACAEGLALYL